MHVDPFKAQQIMRHETLALLRGIAILGQVLTLCLAIWYFKIDLNYRLAFLVVAFWATINVAQFVVLPRGYILKPLSIFVLLVIDLIELTAMLAICGGLNNPFAILLIVPAVLGANTLRTRTVILLVIFSIMALFVVYVCTQTVYQEAVPLEMPILIQVGHFAAVVVALTFLSFFAHRIATENLNMTRALSASELALQREHRLASLGGLVAAYAHELGTPLATIRLASNDVLSEKLSKNVRADIEVISEEVRRCSNILADMGQIGKDDIFVKTTTLLALIQEAAMPHQNRGKEIVFFINDQLADQDSTPIVQKSSAIIHSLRNIIQNAVDFAKSTVEIHLLFSETTVRIRVIDDGVGYPADVLHKIGEPYIRSRAEQDRSGYQGMGLGLFISKTLLASTNASIHFANTPKQEQMGAVVTVVWKLRDLVVSEGQYRGALGPNQEQVL